MRNRTVAICSSVVLCVAAVAGCGDRHASTPAAPASSGGPGQTADAPGEADVLRVRADARRNRVWVLANETVRVYDTTRTQRHLVRTIQLPNWSVIGVDHVCLPDLAVDAAGSAFVSSNAQARLLRIDGDTFAVDDYAIEFPGNPGRDSGFGALVFAADGTLFARTTLDGALWEIDISRARAIMIEFDGKLPLDECTITPQLLKHAQRSQQP